MKLGLQINQAVQLHVQGTIWGTRVAQITEDAIDVLDPWALKPVPETQEPIEVHYLAPFGLTWFNTTILAREQTPLALLRLSVPSEVTFHNRRGSFRLPVDLPVIYRTTPGSEEYFRGVTRDLSMIGCLLMPEEDGLEVGCQLHMELHLPGTPIHIFGQVVTSSTTTLPEEVESDVPKTTTLYGVQFIGVAPVDEDRIVQYLFHEQRRRRQGGIL